MTTDPLGEYLSAFAVRFATTRSMIGGSTMTRGRPGGRHPLTACACGPRPPRQRAMISSRSADEEVEVGLGQGGRVLQRDVVTGRGNDGSADVAGHVRELPGYCVPEIGLRAD